MLLFVYIYFIYKIIITWFEADVYCRYVIIFLWVGVVLVFNNIIDKFLYDCIKITFSWCPYSCPMARCCPLKQSQAFLTRNYILSSNTSSFPSLLSQNMFIILCDLFFNTFTHRIMYIMKWYFINTISFFHNTIISLSVKGSYLYFSGIAGVVCGIVSKAGCTLRSAFYIYWNIVGLFLCQRISQHY